MKNKSYLKIYKNLIKIRLVEEKIAEEYKKQEIRCPVHLSIGQEAIAAPLKEIFSRNDVVVSGHRAHSHYLGKGGDVKKFICELYGKKNGFSKGKAGSMHLFDKTNGFYGSSPIVANIIPVGVGIALSNKIKKKKNIVIVFFGDGATEEGVFYESLNFAALHNLNIIFVCENNFYSVYSNLKFRQPKGRKNYNIAKALKLKSYSANGNNIDKVIEVFTKAKKYVSTNKKPIFLEFSTYRFVEHCGPNNDDNLKYRPYKEIKKWLTKDPINKLKKKLSSNDQDLLKSYADRAKNEIIKIFEFAKKSKFPEQSAAYKNLYEKNN